MARYQFLTFPLICTVWMISCHGLLVAQDEANGTEEPPAKEESAEKSKEDSSQVVVQREPIQLISQRSYQVPLYLEPIQKVQVASPITGTVNQMEVKTGDVVKKDQQLVQMDNTVERLELEKATASREMAEIQLRIAEKSQNDDEIQLATARVAYSRADLELAKYHFAKTSVRAPFNGRIFRVEATQGQQVQRGWTLMTIGDVSELTVEIPVDRNKVKEGDTIQIGIENQNVPVKVNAIIPLADRFAPIRELVDSAASAVVTLSNTSRKYQPGQSVFVPIIPRHPVTEVANSSISNASGGKRKVQVLRDNFVRDIEVQVFGPVGATRSFVSGHFLNEDLIITGTSRPLADGTHIQQMMEQAPASSGRTPRSTGGSRPKKAGVGF